MLQRFVLLLGHPVYSLTVTLFSLLLGTGLGAAWSRHGCDERTLARSTALMLMAIAAISLVFIGAPQRAVRPFRLIALGESVVAVGTSTGHGDLDLADGCAVAAAFALSCGLWWVYFHFAADAMRYSLATARVQLDITRLVLSYGHLSFIGAVIVVSVGLHDSDRPRRPTSSAGR